MKLNWIFSKSHFFQKMQAFRPLLSLLLDNFKKEHNLIIKNPLSKWWRKVITKIRKMCIGWHLPSIFWGELEHTEDRYFLLLKSKRRKYHSNQSSWIWNYHWCFQCSMVQLCVYVCLFPFIIKASPDWTKQ